MAHAMAARRRAAASLTIIAALCAAALAIYLYITPLTGVNDTLGAMVVAGASIAVAVGGLLMAATGRTLWRWLTLLGVLGTALAAFFLHGWWIIVAMAVALLGIVIDAASAGIAHSKGRT